MEKDLISKDYVSFETEKLLKQKGFDADCAAVYDLEFPKSCADGKSPSGSLTRSSILSN